MYYLQYKLDSKKWNGARMLSSLTILLPLQPFGLCHTKCGLLFIHVTTNSIMCRMNFKHLWQPLHLLLARITTNSIGAYFLQQKIHHNYAELIGFWVIKMCGQCCKECGIIIWKYLASDAQNCCISPENQMLLQNKCTILHEITKISSISDHHHLLVQWT